MENIAGMSFPNATLAAPKMISQNNIITREISIEVLRIMLLCIITVTKYEFVDVDQKHKRPYFMITIS